MESTLEQIVPGATLGFVGTLKNDNDYPVVDGSVYVKIFRREGDMETNAGIRQNGYPLIDQFALPETFTLPAKGEKPVSFEWNVPSNAKSGEYFAAFFFQSAKRYNLLGLSFTDDVTGNQTSFSVINEFKTQSVEFDKYSVTLNDKAHNFTIFPLHFTQDETVTAKVKLVNPSNRSVTVPITWKTYAWDGLREDQVKDQKTESITLAPQETKELAYAVKPIEASVSYVVVEAADQGSKSILDIRFVRDGIKETRINFPGVLKYPLTQNEDNTVFSCVHATNVASTPGNSLTLTLKDQDRKVIHSYTYEGDITGAMMGVKDVFTPKETFSTFTLTATLKHDGKIVDEVTQTYDCEQIDASRCQAKQPALMNSLLSGDEESGLKQVYRILAGLGILSLVALLVFFMRKKRGVPTLLIMFLASAMFLGGAPQASAKSVVWNTGMIPNLDYYWNDGAAYSSTSGGWLPGVSDATGTITYSAQIRNATTGAIITNGTSVPVGTKLKFEAIPHKSTDISWNGTGYSSDSPYGAWVSGAAAPADPLLYYLGRAKDQYWNIYYRIYVPLSINPPAVSSVPNTSNLSCVSGICTVTALGPIQDTVTFGATYGKFYYKYFQEGEGGLDYYNKVAMRRGPKAGDILGTTYASWSDTANQLIVPQQAIALNLTAVSGNPPDAPTITPVVTNTNLINQAQNFSIQATDPNNDNVLYQLDWNNDGLPDQNLPATGTVASGVSQNLVRTWATPGIYSIKARTMDVFGFVSATWTTISVTINSAPINGSCGAAINTCGNGVTATNISSTTTLASWTCNGLYGGNPAPCSMCIPSWGPAPSTACVGSTITQTNNCNTSTQIVAGTTTNLWTPADLSGTCSSSTVLQTDSCTGAQRIVNGAKTCSLDGWQEVAP